MAVERHPLVELMLARMKTHPEEFASEFGRWEHALRMISEHASDEDAEMVKTAHNAIILDSTHDWAMDELCNGEERRRRAEQERVAQMGLYQQMVQQQSAQPARDIQKMQNQSYGRYADGTSLLGAAQPVSPPSTGGLLGGSLKKYLVP